MNRRGAALFVALVVVVMAGMVTVLATMVAVGEVRSGAAWRDRIASSALAASALAHSIEAMEAAFDSVTTGGSVAINDTILLYRLGDSVGLVSTKVSGSGGQEVVATVVQARRDSAGGLRLKVPGSRARFRPIP